MAFPPGAPEEAWATLWNTGMLGVPLPPRNASPHVEPASTSVTATKANVTPALHPPPEQEVTTKSPLPPRSLSTSRVVPVDDARHLSTEHSQDEGEWMGDVFHSHLHSLDAIRITDGFIDTHLNDLLWFHDRLLEHHATLLRTRNLHQKTLDGVTRTIYMRGRQTELRDTLADADVPEH